METLLEVRHKPFKYLFVPADIAADVEEREFEGSEGAFQNVMRSHFAREGLYGDQTETLRKNLLEDSTDKLKLPEEQIKRAMELSQGAYQIIPLIMPKKDNGHIATNLYIDNIGRVKDLPTNARATRIASDNIRGDAFIACAHDNEDEPFERVSCTKVKYEELLNNPPSAEKRWSQLQAMEQMKANLAGGGGEQDGVKKLLEKAKATNEPPKEPVCHNCFKPSPNLKKCGKCHKVSYCNRDCQVNDWSFHKRDCK